MTRHIKWGIWAYFLLLIFEGSLRKWVIPGASDILLVIRAPLALVIYILAVGNGIVPRNAFLSFTFVLAVGSFVFAFLGGQSNIWVTLYGIQTNYLHIPLIWIMAEVLDRRDVRRFGYVVLGIAIVMTWLMVVQFRSPGDAWVNRGAGGSEDAQIHGALGRIRPPGFFSFIVGPMMFYPLATAFFLNLVTEKKKLLAWWFVLLAGLFIVLAMPVSISRGVAIISGCVFAVFLFGLMIKGAFNVAVLRIAITAAVLLVALSYLPVFEEAKMVFMDRWDTAAAESDGDAWGSLTERVATGFTTPFDIMLDAPVFGYGIGVGSNVGAKLLSGKVGFLLSENEWERAMLELGPLLGLGFIGLRVFLTAYLLRVSWIALRTRGDLLPLVIWAASVPPLLLQQWSQATQLGFAVFDAGLILAAVKYPVDDPEFGDEDDDSDDDDDEEENDGDADEENDGDDDDPEIDERTRELERRRRHMRGLA